jgi:hypothetical protein
MDERRFRGQPENVTFSGSASPEIAVMNKGTSEVFGAKIGDKVNRSPAEIQEIKEKIGLIARVFSRNYDLTVVPSPMGGWACSLNPRAVEGIEKYLRGEITSMDEIPDEEFRPKQILYDAKEIVDRPEDEVIGIIRHEVGHANNTDYKLFIKGQRLAMDEGYMPTSWAEIFNALEDPWVNNKEIAGSDVVREKIGKLYEGWIEEVDANINTQPVTRQLGLNIIHHWLTGENIPSLKDKKVLDTFEKIKPHAEEYFKAATAQDNFDNLKNNIWDTYKELESKAIDDEKLKELARQLGDSDLGKPQEPQEGGKGQGSGQQQDKGLLSKIRKSLGLGGDEEGEGEPSQEKQNLEREAQSKAGSDLKKKLAKELGQQEKEQKDVGEKLEQQGKEGAGLPEDIDLSKLPQDVREALEKIAEQLSEQAKRELEKEAKENLDKKQAQDAKKHQPKSFEMKKDKKTGQYVATPKRAPSEKEIEKIKEQIEEFNQEIDQRSAAESAQQTQTEAQNEQERARQLEQELERQDMLKNGFEEDEKDLYRKFKELENTMQQRISNFLKILDKYLPKKETYEYGGEHYTGTKLNKKAITKRAPIKDYRIYERRDIVESTEPRMFVELLIDNSGSMSGTKMEESLKTAIFWSRVLRRFEIPFAVKFFGDQVLDVMKFDDDYDDPKKKIKPKLVRSADASGGSTDMGSPLQRANDEMTTAKRKYTGSYGAVFVISDSGANSGKTGAALREYIETMQKHYLVMNFILSQSPGEIAQAKELFGENNVVAPARFEDLPDESFKVLRVTLERILKIYKPTQ